MDFNVLNSHRNSCSLALIISVFIATGCSGTSQETQSLDEIAISKFIGTWKACEVDGTAGDIRLTFMFDGNNAVFVSETIGFYECGPNFLTEETAVGSSPYIETGKLVFNNSVIDTALGFSSYPVIFINSGTDKPDATELVYTDGSVLYFGADGSRPSEDEAPTALDTTVTYEYTGPPDVNLVGFGAIHR